MAHPGGRPSIYNKELAKKICKRLAEGESLRSICLDDDMPVRSTVLEWAIDLNHEFSVQYMQARDIQADSMADDIVDIADDGSNDWIEREMRNGRIETVVDNEHVNRSRLRVDARKWVASKLKPKRYGDRQAVEVSGKLSFEDLITKSWDEKA